MGVKTLSFIGCELVGESCASDWLGIEEESEESGNGER